MKFIKYIRTTVASLALMLGVALPNVATVGAQGNEDNVTICHRTNSVKNPYVQLTVDPDSVDGNTDNDKGKKDHSEHTGPIATSEEVAQALKDAKTDWGDIIPPHDNYAGLNWTAEGQAIYEAGCGDVDENDEVVPAAVTFKAPTCELQGSYTIPTTENVVYKINGQVVAPGTYTAQNGTTVTVTAEAAEDFFIGDETADSWSFTFTAPATNACVLGQVTTTPSGSVNAGGGGASKATGAVAGLVGSIFTLALGLVLRKRMI